MARKYTLSTVTTISKIVHLHCSYFITGPPPVVNLSYTIISMTEVKLLWNDPCPSNGRITKYRINRIPVDINNCDPDPGYGKCFILSRLEFGRTYNKSVCSEIHYMYRIAIIPVLKCIMMGI